MFCRQKNFCAIKVLLLGSLFLVALGFTGVAINKYQRANFKSSPEVSETQRYEPRERGNSTSVTINIGSNTSEPLFYIFQILFWLFFISPPVIVVLLLVIINKMNKNSIK